MRNQLRVKRDERRISLIQGLDEGFVEAADWRSGAMEAPDVASPDDDAGGVGVPVVVPTFIQQFLAVQEEPISSQDDHALGVGIPAMLFTLVQQLFAIQQEPISSPDDHSLRVRAPVTATTFAE